MKSTLINPLISALENSFWQFSLQVYSQPEVKEICLSLQNETGANVNLLLCCCWLAHAANPISLENFKKGFLLVQNWQGEITSSLRKVRQSLKLLAKDSWINEFYQCILEEELVSEAYQQKILFEHFKPFLSSSFSKNDKLALQYLSWLFAEMKTKFPVSYSQQLVERVFACLHL